MKETSVIQKVADAESALNSLLDDYNKLLDEYKAQTSFSKKIKQVVLVKKVDVAIYNVFNTTTALLQYTTLKRILSTDLAKHYIQLLKTNFNEYKTVRESVFGTRKSKILQKRKATGQKKKASLHSVPVLFAAVATLEAIL